MADQQPVLGHHHSDRLGAKRTQRLGHLAADRTATDHHQPPRYLFDAGRLPVRPRLRVPQTRDSRDERVAAGGEPYCVASLDRFDLAVRGCHSHDSPSGQTPLTSHERGGQLLDPAHLRAVVIVADELVAPGGHCGGVDRTGQLYSGHARDRGGQFHGPKQRFARDTPVVAALPSGPAPLHYRSGESSAHSPSGGYLPRRTCPYHDHVEDVSLVTAPSTVGTADDF